MTLGRSLLFAAAGVSGGTTPPPPPPPDTWAGHVPGKVYLGTSEISTRTTQNTVQQIGADLGLEREFYINYTSAAAEDTFIAGAHSRNRIPWISYKVSQTDATIQSDWAAIAAGSNDAAHAARADRYNAAGRPVIVTFSGQPERNGTTITHANNFRAAWKRLAGIYNTRPNVVFVPIIGDYVWHGDAAKGTDWFGDLSWWLDDAMLTAMPFLGVRSDKNLANDTYAERLPAVLSYLDGRGFPSKMIGIGLTAGFDTSQQTGAAWWTTSWEWVVNNVHRVGAVAYHNTNADPPPPEAGTRPGAPTSFRIAVAATQTSVGLAWNAPASDAPILNYRLYRGGTLIASPTGLSATVSSGLSAGLTYTFEVSAFSENGEGARASLNVTMAGGTTPEPEPTGSVVVYAAGDIAQDLQYSGNMGQHLTGPLIANDTTKDAVLAMGDIAYLDGTYTEFMQNYHPYWGSFKAITAPAPGNHDYHTAGLAGYKQYFAGSRWPGGSSPTWYSFNLGAWHIISLDSEVMGATQLAWLDNDIAQWKTTKATRPGLLAFWHHARWTSIVRAGGGGGGTSSVQPFVDRLTAAKADLLVQAHDHAYERFGQLNASGGKVAGGTRHFVVGTGGRGLYFEGPTLPGSEARIYNSWGVVKLTLGPSSYSWQWRPAQGQTGADSGTTAINPK